MNRDELAAFLDILLDSESDRKNQLLDTMETFSKEDWHKFLTLLREEPEKKKDE